MSQVEELYPEFSLVCFKSIITNWVNKDKHPIKKVTLYRNVEPEPRYVLVAEVPSLPAEKIRGRQEFRRHRREEDPDSSHPLDEEYPDHLKYTDEEYALIDVYNLMQEDCGHLSDWLPQIYEGTQPDQYWDELMWFTVTEGEELADGFVREDTRYVLYGDIEKVSEAMTNNDRTLYISDMPWSNPEEHIIKRKAEGASTDIIAYELYGERRGLHHVQIARILGLDSDIHHDGQFKAIKQRGKRAVDSGRRLAEKNTKKV